MSRPILNVLSIVLYFISASFRLYAYRPAPSLHAWFAMKEHADWEIASVRANKRAALSAAIASMIQAVAIVVR